MSPVHDYRILTTPMQEVQRKRWSNGFLFVSVVFSKLITDELILKFKIKELRHFAIFLGKLVQMESAEVYI